MVEEIPERHGSRPEQSRRRTVAGLICRSLPVVPVRGSEGSEAPCVGHCCPLVIASCRPNKPTSSSFAGVMRRVEPRRHRTVRTTAKAVAAPANAGIERAAVCKPCAGAMLSGLVNGRSVIRVQKAVRASSQLCRCIPVARSPAAQAEASVAPRALRRRFFLSQKSTGALRRARCLPCQRPVEAQALQDWQHHRPKRFRVVPANRSVALNHHSACRSHLSAGVIDPATVWEEGR